MGNPVNSENLSLEDQELTPTLAEALGQDSEAPTPDLEAELDAEE